MAAAKFERVAFVFNGTKVYDALFLKDKVPTYFVGCSATILKVIEKKAIPQDQFWFASYTAKSGYKDCSADYKARRLLIRADWVEKNVPGFGAAPPAAEAPKPKVYPPAPPVLELQDTEKFRDDNDETVDIEVRGDRTVDGIWFKARDLERMLLLENIRSVVGDVKSSYEEVAHYRTFSLDTSYRGDKKPDCNQTALFLSYWGLVKMLFGRRHPVAINFQRWAISKLFTLQMGTQGAKEELAADVMGVSPATLKAVLNTNVNALPTVYLFQLGTVGQLRKALDIPESFRDDDIVLKYGLTKDLKRRTGEHETAFKKLQYQEGGRVMLLLRYHVYIDPVFLSAAEADVEAYFKGAQWHLTTSGFTELAVVPDHMLSSIVHNEFKRLGTAYAGRLQDLQMQLQSEQRVNQQLKVQLEAQDAVYRDMRLQAERELQTQRQVLEAQQQYSRELMDEKNARIREKDATIELYQTLLRRHDMSS